MSSDDCVVCRICLLVLVRSFVLLIAHFFLLPNGKKPIPREPPVTGATLCFNLFIRSLCDLLSRPLRCATVNQTRDRVMKLRVAMRHLRSQRSMTKMNLSTRFYSDIEFLWIFEPFARSSMCC